MLQPQLGLTQTLERAAILGLSLVQSLLSTWEIPGQTLGLALPVAAQGLRLLVQAQGRLVRWLRLEGMGLQREVRRPEVATRPATPPAGVINECSALQPVEFLGVGLILRNVILT